MSKLERYLDQVCRSMGGPKALRDHVRQELREHLLDAAAQHQAEGLAADAAVARALEEFGQPEVVRTELEATHGHRQMLAVVLDKALQWKETTMKAKWLWTTWTYLMVVGIIALELLYCCFCVIYILPKIKKVHHDGLLLGSEGGDSALTWMYQFLTVTVPGWGEWFWWLLLGLVTAWGLFEWRVKGENKAFMRLSALNSLALGLLVIVVLMSVSMVLPLLVSMPSLARMSRPWVVQEVKHLDASLTAAQAAAQKADRPEVEKQLLRISATLRALSSGPAFSTWLLGGDQAAVEAMQQSLDKTSALVRQTLLRLSELEQASLEKLIQELKNTAEPLLSLQKNAERRE